jgi:nucleotidyltransferase/DNA polymerase involved in DNA repair
MAIACLAIPHFAMKVATIQQRSWEDDVPMVLRDPARTDATVIDATPEAMHHGIRPGQTIREALALSPLTTIVSRDPVAEARQGDVILHHLLQVSPLVEADERDTGCWYIDLIGLERYYGSLAGAVRAIRRGVPPHLAARIGIAPTRFTARIAAGSTDGATTTRILSKPEMNAFLQDVSVSWLPVDPDLIHQLVRLGITTLGLLASLDRRKLTSRFGTTGRTIWELANGIDKRQVMATRLPVTITETASIPSPAISHGMLMAHLHRLVIRAFRQPELRGRYVRTAVVRAMLDGGGSWERTLVIKVPADADALMQSLRLRLSSLEFTAPIEEISLTLTDIVDEPARQRMLPALRPRSLTNHQLDDVSTQLTQRYGTSPLYRIVEVEPWSRIPERRHALLSFVP